MEEDPSFCYSHLDNEGASAFLLSQLLTVLMLGWLAAFDLVHMALWLVPRFLVILEVISLTRTITVVVLLAISVDLEDAISLREGIEGGELPGAPITLFLQAGDLVNRTGAPISLFLLAGELVTFNLQAGDPISQPGALITRFLLAGELVTFILQAGDLVSQPGRGLSSHASC